MGALPETMLTYLPERKLLFTCDFLGSHLATSSLFIEDERLVYLGAKDITLKSCLRLET